MSWPKEDAFFDKTLEGFALFAFNQGEVCTCPSRALVQESIYERFMERAIKRVEAIKTGNPLDRSTMMGAQVSTGQMESILNYHRYRQARGGGTAYRPPPQAGGG